MLNIRQINLFLCLTIMSISCKRNCRLKEKGYSPQFFSISSFEDYTKRKYQPSHFGKKINFFIKHECAFINPQYFVILVSSGDILICEKYNNLIQIEIDSTYFISGKNFQIQLFDPELNQIYIWSKDSPVYINSDVEAIKITLKEKISSESEFIVSD